MLMDDTSRILEKKAAIGGLLSPLHNAELKCASVLGNLLVGGLLQNRDYAHLPSLGGELKRNGMGSTATANLGTCSRNDQSIRCNVSNMPLVMG